MSTESSLDRLISSILQDDSFLAFLAGALAIADSSRFSDAELGAFIRTSIKSHER